MGPNINIYVGDGTTYFWAKDMPPVITDLQRIVKLIIRLYERFESTIPRKQRMWPFKLRHYHPLCGLNNQSHT